MKYHTILPCGHDAVLPKRWAVAICPTCGKKYEAVK